jgi:Zn-dependent membrane protease YugP
MAGPHEMHYGLPRSRFQVTPKAGDVGAGAEGATGTGDHYDPNRRIELHLVQSTHERVEQLAIQRVELGSSVQRQKFDSAMILTLQ